jgi:hypothetical protein
VSVTFLNILVSKAGLDAAQGTGFDAKDSLTGFDRQCVADL